MAKEAQVTCSTKDGPDQDRRIDGIGGTAGGGWYLATPDAITAIKSGEWTFYTVTNGVRANVLVRGHPPREYLTTSPDGIRPNNLLALPNCRR